MIVRKSSIKEQVYQELKKRIINGEYSMGASLNIVHLSQEFGVSNTPIREALAMLEQDKLVSSTANAQFRVIEFDERQLSELNAAILSLLIGSVCLCMSDNRMKYLDQNLEDALTAQIATDDADIHSKYNAAVAVDESIVRSTQNPLLIDVFEKWSALLRLSVALTNYELHSSVEEHRRILEAVRTGDLMQIINALKVHYSKHLFD